jgi:dTDP-4-amino-4,6-dideoxygalactose transaminase
MRFRNTLRMVFHRSACFDIAGKHSASVTVNGAREIRTKPGWEELMLCVAEPSLGPEEKAALAEVIDSGWITMGERVAAFEQAFAKTHGARDSIAVSSCTGGLHLIVHALGLGPGDEVLVPAMTFVATANCVLYAGATPVFVDIESTETPLMSLDDAAAKCTDKTKAVILVHYAGYLADRSLWRDFAAERGIYLIEDAAHAAGLEDAGTFGAAAAFSFYGNKNMTTAEGGAVIASDERLEQRIRQMRSHGLTSGTFQRHSSAISTYDVTALGFNYRMDELRAAVGLVQLRKLKSWNEQRAYLTQLYRTLLNERVPELEVPFADPRPSANHIMPVVLPKQVERQIVVERLRNAGIQTTIHYPPVHHFSFYRSRFPSLSLPTTEEYAARELTLPLHVNLKETHVDRIAHALAESIRS